MCTPSAAGGQSPNKTSGPSYDKALQGYVQSGRIKESKFVKPPKNAGESSSAYSRRVLDLRNNFSTSEGYVARESDKMLKARRKTERQAYIDNWQAANPGQDPSSAPAAPTAPTAPAVSSASSASSGTTGFGGTVNSSNLGSNTGTSSTANALRADRLANKLKQKAAQRASRASSGRAMLRIGA
jgi:hypothetical protein